MTRREPGKFALTRREPGEFRLTRRSRMAWGIAG